MSQKIIPISQYKFPAYSLPKLYGWHSIPLKLKDSKGTYGNFGANWWDLLAANKLLLHKGKITLNTKESHSLIFINLGKDTVKMKNEITGDIYVIFPGKRSSINNLDDKDIFFVADNPECEIQLTKIYSSHLILLNVQDIRNGKSIIKDSVIFTDFLLMSGVPDKTQYFDSVGIESLDYTVIKGWKFLETETGVKDEFTTFLLDQWKICNPSSRGKAKEGIPRVIQFIWLRKDIRKKEYGGLKPHFYKFMNTWIQRNPGFTFNLWSDNPQFKIPKQFQGILNIRGPDEIKTLLNKLDSSIKNKIKYLYYHHENVGVRSDTLRQAILYLEGGIYGDNNDSACLVSLEKISQKFDYLIGVEPVLMVNNAIIGSKKRHIISKNMLIWLAHISKSFTEEWNRDYRHADQDSKDDFVVSFSGPIALSSVLFGVFKQHFSKLKHSLILPSSWVYSNYFIKESPTFWLKPTSIFAHYDARDFLK